MNRIDLWKRKIQDLLDYHEGALDVIDEKLVKPKPINEVTAMEEEKKMYRVQNDLHRKANSYAKSMITSSIINEVSKKSWTKESAHDA